MNQPAQLLTHLVKALLTIALGSFTLTSLIETAKAVEQTEAAETSRQAQYYPILVESNINSENWGDTSFCTDAINPVPTATICHPDKLKQFNLNLTPIGQTIPIEVPPPTGAGWYFRFEPWVSFPLWLNGGISVGGLDVGINLSPNQIFSASQLFNYGITGNFEAWWNPEWGFSLSGVYAQFGINESRSRSVPPRLAAILPSVFTANARVDLTKIDLAILYRLGDLSGVSLKPGFTEFDLPPFTFTTLAGLRYYSFTLDASVTTNLSTLFSATNTSRMVEPLIGGKARWNLTDNLGVDAGFNIAGFGIEGLTFSYQAQVGVDWMFSGNTSFYAGYQLSHLDQVSRRGNDRTAIDLTGHGPYFSFIFRF